MTTAQQSQPTLMNAYDRIRNLLEAEFPGMLGASVHVIVDGDTFDALSASNKRYRAPGGRGLVLELGGVDLSVIDESVIDDEDDRDAEE